MRTPLVVAIVLLLPLAPLPTVSAQAAGGHLLTDDKGDTAYSTGAGPSVPYSGQGADAADLLSLDLTESEESFVLTLAVASLANGGGIYSLGFNWRDIEYSLEAQRSNPTFGGFQQATLYSSDGAGFERVGNIPMSVDTAASTIAFTIPKVLVLDGAKHPPQRGDVLKNFHVFAEEPTIGRINFAGNGASAASAFDMMPNSGDGANFEMKLGDVQSGTLALATPDRIRVSNGGATTFVFQSIVRNNGSREDEVTLKVTDLPPDWIANVQSPLKVPAHSEKQIAVLVSVPFAHVHGGFSSFNMSATSTRDATNHASMRLGVLHTPIPQPAGHHQELYLHGKNQNNGFLGATPAGSQFAFAQGYFNTEAAHDGDVDVYPTNGGGNGGLAWSIPLNPGLAMGIDMDLNKTGTLTGAVFGKQQGTGTVSAKLYLVRAKGQSNQSNQGNQDQGILLMDGKGTKVTFDLQKSTPFTLTMTPLDAADYVPYAKGQNLVLVIKTTSDQPNPCCFGALNEPQLSTKDFKMVLPLNEYNDIITGTPDVATGLDLQNVGPIEKAGRPGTIMTYQFALINTASSESVVQVDVAGNDAKLGSLVPQGRVTLGPNENRRLTLAVHIPSDAALGKDLEVLVFAHAQDDPSRMAIARTKTTVTTGANATDDETGVLVAARQAEKKSPGVEAFGALAIVALAALAIRRRR